MAGASPQRRRHDAFRQERDNMQQNETTSSNSTVTLERMSMENSELRLQILSCLERALALDRLSTVQQDVVVRLRSFVTSLVMHLPQDTQEQALVELNRIASQVDLAPQASVLPSDLQLRPASLNSVNGSILLPAMMQSERLHSTLAPIVFPSSPVSTLPPLVSPRALGLASDPGPAQPPEDLLARGQREQASLIANIPTDVALHHSVITGGTKAAAETWNPSHRPPLARPIAIKPMPRAGVVPQPPSDSMMLPHSNDLPVNGMKRPRSSSEPQPPLHVADDSSNEHKTMRRQRKNYVWVSQSFKEPTKPKSPVPPLWQRSVLFHGTVVSAIAMDDSHGVVYTGGKGNIRKWDIMRKEPQLLAELAGLLDGKVVRVCQITRDGSKLFVAGECSQIVVVDLTPSLPRLAGTVAVSVLAIYSLAISRDGRHCFAGADNGSILHIDVNEMKVLKTLQAHAAGVTCINVISKDGSSIVSGGLDSMLRVWCVETGKQTLEISLAEPVYALAPLRCAENKKCILAGMVDGQMALVNLETMEQKTIPGVDKGVLSIRVSKRGAWFAAISLDSVLTVWDSTTLEKRTQFSDVEGVLCFDISTDGKRVMLGTNNHVATVYDMSDIIKE